MSASPPGRRPLVFVGGTGRSGTHVISALLEQHSRYARIPIEARFHCNPQGFPDLLSGEVGLDQFLGKMRKFWWRRIRAGEVLPVVAKRMAMGRKVRGLHKVVDRDRFEVALETFERAWGEDREAACRELFYDLLWPVAEQAGKPALVEMSCFTIAAGPALTRIFPDARLIHIIRDGRDAGSSKVSKRQKKSHPSDGFEGIRWWEERLRTIEAGVRGLPDGAMLALSLDQLVAGEREASYRQLLDFLGIDDEPTMRAFFEEEMSADAAHQERWRDGLDPAEQDRLVAEYERTLEQLENEGFHCAPILRSAYQRAAA